MHRVLPEARRTHAHSELPAVRRAAGRLVLARIERAAPALRAFRNLVSFADTDALVAVLAAKLTAFARLLSSFGRHGESSFLERLERYAGW
jgi:hypothetical protein